ncbi:TlpA family protein disulfide reductase [Oceanithermus sp.]
MKKKKINISALVILLIAGFLLGWFLLAPGGGSKPGGGSDVPNVTLPRLGGGEVNLSRFVGKPLVLNLWATWCPPCRQEMPLLTKTAAERKDVVFVFAAQDRGNSAALVRQYLDQTGLVQEWALLDSQNVLQQKLKTTGLPTTYFFDRKGRLVAKHVGAITPEILQKSLELITK